jgi:hypothetical protein
LFSESSSEYIVAYIYRSKSDTLIFVADSNIFFSSCQIIAIPVSSFKHVLVLYSLQWLSNIMAISWLQYEQWMFTRVRSWEPYVIYYRVGRSCTRISCSNSLVSLSWFLASLFIKSAVQWENSIVVAHHCCYQRKLSWIDLVIMPSSLQKSEAATLQSQYSFTCPRPYLFLVLSVFSCLHGND